MYHFKSKRRDVLKLLGIGAGAVAAQGPLLELINAIIRGQLSKAYGQAGSARKWVDFVQNGAPPRWVFDLMLQPYRGGAAFVPNAQVGTRYVASGGVYTDVTYATVAKYGINVPHIWNFPVPTSGGGTRPMTDLLRNYMGLRGLNTNNPGHLGSQQLHFLPLGLTQSLPALAGDAASTALAAIYTPTGGYNYYSKVGKTAVQVAGRDLIATLMTPFTSVASTSFREGQAALQTYLDAATATMLDQASSGYASAGMARDAVNGANSLIRRSFGDLSTTWSDLLEKYTLLIRASLDPSVSLEGINDKPIGVSGTRNEAYSIDREEIVENRDLRTMINGNTYIENMAEGFAIAEFALANDLTSSLTISLAPLQRVFINGSPENMTFDEHFSGKMPTLLLNSYYARAYASCLLEFIDRLRAGGIFEHTVICCGGEFNRAPLNTGFGTGHGYEGQSLAFYSGCIRGPMVVGNIAANAPGGNYSGTWGYNAQTARMDLDLGHAAATIARMLGVPSPSVNRSPLIEFDTATGKVKRASGIPEATEV